MTDLKMKTSVVTGAASGIGRALALQLADEGRAIAVCDVNEEGLAETVAGIERRGAKALWASVDVANEQAVRDFAERAMAELGPVDIVINNAGVSLTDYFENLSQEDFEWIVNINFWGVIYGTRAFLPQMLERKSGHIVNISSIFGIMGIPTQSAYNATKFAVRGFSEALRQEVSNRNVRVLTVHPGGVKTNIVKSSRFGESYDGVTSIDVAARRFEKMAGLTPDGAASIILRAVRTNRRRVLVGKDAIVMDRVARAFPETYENVIRRAMKVMDRFVK